MENHLIDARELAVILNVPLTWVWKWGREGKIPCIRVGKYQRFDLKDVLQGLPGINDEVSERLVS